MTGGGGRAKATRAGLWLGGCEALVLRKMKGSARGVSLAQSGRKEEAAVWPTAPGPRRARAHDRERRKGPSEVATHLYLSS